MNIQTLPTAIKFKNQKEIDALIASFKHQLPASNLNYHQIKSDFLKPEHSCYKTVMQNLAYKIRCLDSANDVLHVTYREFEIIRSIVLDHLHCIHPTEGLFPATVDVFHKLDKASANVGLWI